MTERVKFYDRKCPGLNVSITTTSVATFSFKFTDRTTGKQRTGWLGVYNSGTFTVEDARSRVYGLKAMGAAAPTETFRDQKAARSKRCKTVSEIIDERIKWMKTRTARCVPDWSWENTASHLNNFVRSRLNKKRARPRVWSAADSRHYKGLSLVRPRANSSLHEETSWTAAERTCSALPKLGATVKTDPPPEAASIELAAAISR